MVNGKQGTLLRTKATWERYQNQPVRDDCFMCVKRKIVKEFEHWLIIENDFPYDAVASIHHLAIPREHITTLNKDTLEEYQNVVVHYVDQNYDFTGTNTPGNRTQPQHFHLHLLKWIRQS